MKNLFLFLLFFLNLVIKSQTDSLTMKLSNGNITYAINNKLTIEDGTQAYRYLGSSLICQTVDFPIGYCNTSTALVDAQVKFTAVLLPISQTITGITIYGRINGVYTGDNNNRVGLYSYNNGTLTLVASSVNNANLWTTGANSFVNIALTAQYQAARGIYYVGILYNNSAQTTAPTIATGTALNNLIMASPGTTNSAKLHGTVAAQTDLPATINMTGITGSTIPTWVALY